MSLLVPTPKYCNLMSRKMLISHNNTPSFKINCAHEHFDDALTIINQELEDSGFRTYSNDAGADFSIKILFTEDINQSIELLSEEDKRFILKQKSEQAFILKSFAAIQREKNVIVMIAPGISGILYATVTLKQLLKSKSGIITCPELCIRDYPDFEYRVACRWLICLEADRWSYDWGDGREKLLRRFREKLTFCLRHKINMIFFDGFEWNSRKYPEYAADMRQLNKYASDRGIKLIFGGHGIGIGGRDPEAPGIENCGFMKGLGDKNRRSYPDGELYPCCGLKWEEKTRYNGTCRSNKELNKLKKSELKKYVTDIEPRALYIHNEDVADFAIGSDMWKLRCPGCRKKWKNDNLEKIDGGAGAIAFGMNQLCEAVFSVKNKKSGYDAERDCVIILVSPAYGDYLSKDETWDKIVEMWSNISKGLKYNRNVLLGFREQFWRMDNSQLRIKELAKSLEDKGNGHGIFVFSVGGADLFSNNAMISATPLLNNYFEGATAVFNFSGILFQEPQQLINSEFSWNSSPAVDLADTYEEAVQCYRKYTDLHYLPDEFKLSDAFFSKYCEYLYGVKAGKWLFKLNLLESGSGEFPLSIMFYPFKSQQLFWKLEEIEKLDFGKEAVKWRNILELNTKAIEYTNKALECDDLNKIFLPDIKHLLKCLNVGAQFARIIADIFNAKKNNNKMFQNINSNILRLEKYIANEFQFQFSSPGNSDIELWYEYIKRVKKTIIFLSGNKKYKLIN